MTKMHKMLKPFLDETQPKRGLPAAAYTDSGFWDAECGSVFARNWVCIGFSHELAEPGAVVPVTAAGSPLLMARDSEGGIRVFHNVCRHRCLKLVDRPQNVGKLIRCPYHAWAYDLSGALRASPHFGGTGRHDTEGFNRSLFGLAVVRTHVWHDWIFVNLDAAAPPFEEYAASLIRRLEDIEWKNTACVATLDFGEISANWKFIMENFIEPYHVQFVHSSTTKQPLSDHYTIIDGNCMGSAVDLGSESGTSGSLAVSSRYLALYPNFILGRYFPDQLGVYLNIPTGPNTMTQKRGIYMTDGKTPDAEEIEGLKNLWSSVHKEDHDMVERMQKGRASAAAADGGVLSPVWEDSVRAFQDLVAADVTGRGKAAEKGIPE